MPYYSDKRSRYAGAAPWDFSPGTGRADNPTKTEAKTMSGARVPDSYEQNEKGEFVLKPGNKSPRDNFRVTTARKEPSESNLEQPQLPQNQQYERNESLRKSPDVPAPVSQNSGLSPSESSAKLTHALMSDDAPASEEF